MFTPIDINRYRLPVGPIVRPVRGPIPVQPVRGGIFNRFRRGLFGDGKGRPKQLPVRPINILPHI